MEQTSTNKQPASSTPTGSDDDMLNNNNNIFTGIEAKYERYQDPNKAVYVGITSLPHLNRS